MRSPVCGNKAAESMKRYGARPPVCPSMGHSTNFAVRYRSTAARRTAARRYSATATLSANVVADHRLVTSYVQNTFNLAKFFCYFSAVDLPQTL